MKLLKSRLSQLPQEQLQWLMKYKGIVELKDYIERKTFKRGFIDVVLLLDSIDN